jgi:hypothetical protein
MTTTTLPSRSSTGTSYFWVGFWGAAVILITTVHHVWGAYLYDTPWRLHIVFIGVPIAAVFVGLLAYAAGRHGTGAGRIAAWLAIIIIAVFCSLLLGLYEGGYNHVLKNLVYFIHGPVRWMFPDGVTGIPDDVFFEATGIAHLPAGILAGVAGWTVLRDLKR